MRFKITKYINNNSNSGSLIQLTFSFLSYLKCETMSLQKLNHTTQLKTRKNFFTRIVLFTRKTSNAYIVNSTGRTNKSAQLITNQRAETALRRATTGINTGLGCPPDPHQLNNPDDEDRDGLRNISVYES
jgi:hypothetical protein